MNYKLINNALGWLMFLVSLVVYNMTLESSVSLWDCGEFISAAYKLQVVHPPGAPLFLMIGRLFSMFAGSEAGVSVAVNMLSAVASAFTVMFTFWITTHFAKKMVKGKDNASFIAIFASGIIAALALTFSDSFWFSAVEAEVYALSSFFTALTFWAALRWEESDRVDADKWLVMIAYFIGLAIGTHLLNLLVIPAVVFIYYFKHYKPTRKGMLYSLGIGLVILFFVQKGIIPGIPKLMAMMDLFFVNSLGMGFNTGVIFVVVLLIAGTGYGLYYFAKVKINRNIHVGFLCFAYILLGYSSYTMVVVRSMDNPAIDMNNPEEPFNLLSYINREQYGDRPLLYGPYFNAGYVDEDGDGYVDIKDGSAIYRKDPEMYTKVGNRQEPVYDKKMSTIFPRMGDKDKPGSEQGYRSWGGMSDITEKIYMNENLKRQTNDPNEKQQYDAAIQELKNKKPSMYNNLRFFFTYQVGHMYLRYFMWNFVGRQNEQQGHDYNQDLEGGWISGIPFIDGIFHNGPQDKLPEYMANNHGRNKFYFIPLILGVLGLVFHFKKGKNDAIVTMSLFLFTGLLIIVFLNQPPYEPRERDYSLVGSFQTFCIWIGLGVLYLWDFLKGKMAAMTAAALSLVLSLSAPVLMAADGWDDHDRSQRYLGIDFARNYLNSCPPNAILFTNGDNDTYPLWYAQNVEGIRTDIRIINQSLLPTDWYSQVLLTKVYESEPLPLSVTKEQLATGNNDYFQFRDAKNPVPENLDEFINKLVNNNPTNTYGTRRFRVKVDKEAVLNAGVVSREDSASIVDEIMINFPARSLNKGDMVLLDLIAQNAKTGWKRPICFSSTSGDDGFLNMQAYFERRGLIFQLVPIRTQGNSGTNITRINRKATYDLLMNQFRYSGMKEKENFFLDDKASIVPQAIKNMFIIMAGETLSDADKIKRIDSALLADGNKAKVDALNKTAIALLDRANLEIPEKVIYTGAQMKFAMGTLYHEAGDDVKAEKEFKELFEILRQEVSYYMRFQRSGNIDYIKSKAKDSKDWMDRLIEYGKEFKFKEVSSWEKVNNEIKGPFDNFYNNV